MNVSIVVANWLGKPARGHVGVQLGGARLGVLGQLDQGWHEREEDEHQRHDHHRDRDEERPGRGLRTSPAAGQESRLQRSERGDRDHAEEDRQRDGREVQPPGRGSRARGRRSRGRASRSRQVGSASSGPACSSRPVAGRSVRCPLTSSCRVGPQVRHRTRWRAVQCRRPATLRTVQRTHDRPRPPPSKPISTRPRRADSSPTWSSSGSRASRRCRRMRPTAGAPPSGSRRACATAGIEHVEVAETTGHPVVYGGLAPRRGRADDPRLRPLRRAARRSDRPLDLAAVRAAWSTAIGCSARGAADDKGQIHVHVMAAQAILATRGRSPINVRYVFEGEEESSSVHLDAWLEANRDRLAADVAVISDSGFFEGNLPAITIGLARPDVRPDRRRRRAHVDLHSGGFGGVVENPANALARIITALKGPDGRILIPGFYDDVVAAHRRRPRGVRGPPVRRGGPRGRDRRRRRSSARSGTRCSSVAAAARPSTSTASGAGSRATGPRRSSRRTPTPRSAAGSSPDQDPDGVFERFRELRRGDRSARRHDDRDQSLGGGRPSRTPIDHPATQAAARALEATFGRAPVYIREGGSIPVCAELRIDPGPAGRPARVRPAQRQRPRPGRVDGPAQLRDRDPGHRADLGRARRRCRAS